MKPTTENTSDQEADQTTDAGTLDLTETGNDYPTPLPAPLNALEMEIRTLSWLAAS